MRRRSYVITDWCVFGDAALPDALPGKAYEVAIACAYPRVCLGVDKPLHERVIVSQRDVTLCWILVRGLYLERLWVGAVEAAFELYGGDGHLWTFRPARLGHEISLLAGQDVRLLLRDERRVPVKPRAFLRVREEIR